MKLDFEIRILIARPHLELGGGVVNGDAGIIGEGPAALLASFRVAIGRLQGREGNHRQTVSAGAMKAAHIELFLGGGHGHVQEAGAGQEDEGAGHALAARIQHAPGDSRERRQAGFERNRIAALTWNERGGPWSSSEK